MSISLYRKYRPQNFSDVYGQKSAIEIITNSIAKDRVGHAYLFSGSRGCGKTSVARIFAKALNCLERENFEPCGHCSNCLSITQGESLDVIEIDGASNNGVDNIRDLKENVTLAPFTSKYKIYIVDEVHMLSQGAFNALLKTLEEPPEHVIFILATTEPHKVPVTIRSRCQHIPFHTISPQDIYKRLEEVCKLENFNFEPEALWEIARQADGALRDALSLLEQVTAAGDITLANVEASFGAGSRSAFERWLVNLRTSPEDAYEILKSMFEAGASGVRVFEEIFALVRDLWLISKWPKIIGNLGGSEPEKKFLREEASNWKPDSLHYLLNVVNKILAQARMGLRNDIILGMFFMMLEQIQPQETISMPQPAVNAAPPALNSVPPAAHERQITTPSAPTIEDKPNEIEFDEGLKEKILAAAHEKNFLIYCGLFDSRPYEKDKNLILDFQSSYCYEFFRQDRNSATLAEIFSDYSNVIVKFGVRQFTCQSFKFEAAETPQTQVFESVKVQNQTSDENFEAPEQETSTKREKNSAFDKFKQELVRLQTKPEIILIKHEEAAEEAENDLEFEHEEQEGESE
ncbi:MAG: DNA polymerase III subunit gamma/tau [Synergistaceae bacterium]|nr:DNA polymerase III subunit gamma/tau [Synergistaceae bacterium]